MSRDKDTNAAPDTAPRPADPNEFFPGNANRVRNKTVVLSASVTRQIRNMAAIPEQFDCDQIQNSSDAVPASSAGNGPLAVKESGSETQVLGFLVSYDRNPNGEIYPLRKGRWIISSRWHDQSSDCILVEDSSISFAHAIIRVDSSESVQVMDQLSSNGSGIVRLGGNYEEPLREAVSNLRQGDVIRFGERRFHLCLVQGLPAPADQQS